MRAVKEQNWIQGCQETGTGAGTFWLTIRKTLYGLGQDSHRTTTGVRDGRVAVCERLKAAKLCLQGKTTELKHLDGTRIKEIILVTYNQATVQF